MKPLLWGILLTSAVLATGCGATADGHEAYGQLALPLATHGPSGTTYRLRNATFEIHNYDYYYYGVGGASAAGGAGGASTSPANTVFTVSSEDDPSAESIVVDLEQGDYTITLLPGWSMEKLEGDLATPVETTLLSPDTQWVYVYPRSTTWVEYLFGLGGRELWLNGQLNIGIQVAEDPNSYYGWGGSAGAWAGGAGGVGAFSSGGAGG